MPQHKRARSAACQPAVADMVMPQQLAEAEAMAAAKQQQLEARLAKAEESHRQQLASVVAAHQRVVDGLTAQAAEAQRQAAVSGRQVV
jgi:hypothetical protein